MSDPRIEQQTPLDGDESDFGSKLKVRLAIAGALVALALAAIPILDSLTGKKPVAADTTGNAGNIVSSAGLAANPNNSASAAVASAPAATASAAASSQPASSAPTGPNVNQTPGMSATPPLSLPAQNEAATAPAAVPGNQQHRPAAGKPLTQAPVVIHQAGKAFKPGYAPQPGAGAYNPPQGPVSTGSAAQPHPMQAAPMASPAARPAGSSVGYNVQLGLFSNMDNAQKLISELKSKGIEVQSETRVHLAPFRTRAEAEQAVAKLRAMGYAPMLGAAGN